MTIDKVAGVERSVKEKIPSFRYGFFVCVLVGLYARFGLPELPTASTNDFGAFSTPKYFVANPGKGYENANVRSGPGANYQILYEVPRNKTVIGVKRVAGFNGEAWIGLDDNKGHIKETILSPIKSENND
ncbi:hypothetical protein [Pontixanthobacter sp. CEM42]|uniref:hypothetical protein n=1 Tax=Pontixanthobacter sp. CEM42 TaxID=2792077 RepID=UPI001AE08006|nr:hypothetical protein [Pontixanthobacter sp. CEM42]